MDKLYVEQLNEIKNSAATGEEQAAAIEEISATVESINISLQKLKKVLYDK